MYKHADASRIRHEFWTTFGRYMMPVPPANAEDFPGESGETRVNWINYRTGIKDVYFRMDAHRTGASICITVEHADALRRTVFFEQFIAHRKMLEEALGEGWDWQPEAMVGESRHISKICRELNGPSVLRREDWPELISFFKPRLIALDEFWSTARYGFEEL